MNNFNQNYPYPYYPNQPMNYSDNMNPSPYFNNQPGYYPDFSEYNHGTYMELRDYGPAPFVVNIDEATKQNNNYRTALWTGCHLQLTLMSIRVGGDIGLEVHPNVDQFIRIEEGQGLVQMGSSKTNLNFKTNVCDNYAIFIPAGTWHNVTNTGNIPIKLYSIYAPRNHPHGTVQKTKESAPEKYGR